ncbi:MG2 domain-containing protein [Myxococcus sp. K38C18041901]|uniref:MG2 domain-containing protein n=1 Tax=Myxococcus guangdongensis TaxID=2906760 RepID=UPI0020A77DDF|nr:alpha-2-macroglobulin family protein [Myxococcus guangdongensis]MCP3059217.1 MG2 domain-containing protein [Myxococcus guangdongensis]
MIFPVPLSLGALLVLGLFATLLLPSPGDASGTQQPSSPAPDSDRPSTYITTDKPLYRPGEKVFIGGLFLQSLSHKPYQGQVRSQLEIRGPRGEVVYQQYHYSADSAWGIGWDIPHEQPGGEYTARLSSAGFDTPVAERKFDVRAYRAPRLKSHIQFARDGYGPGDTITATLEVKRAEGGVPKGARVTAAALVDGVSAAQVPCTVDDQGHCLVRFALPARMERGEGTLSFTVEDGGVVETAAKTIPILLQTLDLAFFPESGDLVAGLTSRVYFEARTPARKPADLTGAVVDVSTGKDVATVRSEHEGRGRFELTPRAGARYALRIDAPSGIRKTFPLPEVKKTGVVLRASEDVTAAGKDVKLTVASAGTGRVKVTLSQRDLRVSEQRVTGTNVTLDAGAADGVLVATAWAEDGRPLAERLVFRQPAKEVQVELTVHQTRPVPGDVVELTARTTRDGQPVTALVMLSVTDDSVLQLVEKREQAPRLPVMVLLEPEVRELADAQLYLDRKNPKSTLAVDLLLGTQGWRRFGFSDPLGVMQRDPEVGWRFIQLRVGERPRNIPADLLARRDEAREQQDRFTPVDPALAVPLAAPVEQGRPPVEAPPPAPVSPSVVEGKSSKSDAEDEYPVSGHELPTYHWVREYSHALRPGRKPDDRVDFSETLYWSPAVRTDAATGEAKVYFALSDAVTTFRAVAGAVGLDGALGAAELELESVRPFYAEPKLPLEVTSGDVVRLPVSLVNGTQSALKNASVQAEAQGDVTLAMARAVDLAAGARGRQLLSLTIGSQQSKPVDVKLVARAGDYSDTVTRTLAIQPLGFPGTVSHGGLLSANKPASHVITLPERLAPGSIRASIAVYPSPLANMTESLAQLIREPSGCFEQTSSTTYPMTMAQLYFQTHPGIHPALMSSAREMLERGYKRLVSFETKSHGFEWFGAAPGHEALTAYGLLHFTDMKQVMSVDARLVERTRAWLMNQRDGKGNFARGHRASHAWTENAETANAYIAWALLESAGTSRAAQAKELAREIASVKAAASASSNSYEVALAANVLSLAGDGASARALMARLAKLQEPSGKVTGGTQSIVGGWGASLDIETTAIAALAWLREPKAHLENVTSVLRYFAEVNKGGRYGSTQSTVLTLRAINAYDLAHAASLPSGQVRLYVDGRPVGEPVRFTSATREVLHLPDAGPLLGSGAHRVELRLEGPAEIPYTVEVSYHSLVPDSSKDTLVSLEVALAKKELTEGEPTEARVMVTNRTDQHLSTAVAIFGVPGGLEVRHDQLKELVKRKLVDAYEVRGRDVVLYWRGMEPRKHHDIPLSLIAAVPGTYTGAASRAYLYYGDEHKVWTSGVKVTIAPKS